MAGTAITTIGLFAFILPALKSFPGGALVGWLLLVAGIVEIFAGDLRVSLRARRSASIAGGLTLFAGLMLVLEPFTPFVPVVTIVTGWLLVRGVFLILCTGRSTGDPEWIVRISGIFDVLLAFLLVLGVQVSTVVLLLFGPTSDLVARFALVLAVSLVVSGSTLTVIAMQRVRSGSPTR